MLLSRRLLPPCIAVGKVVPFAAPGCPWKSYCAALLLTGTMGMTDEQKDAQVALFEFAKIGDIDGCEKAVQDGADINFSK